MRLSRCRNPRALRPARVESTPARSPLGTYQLLLRLVTGSAVLIERYGAICSVRTVPEQARFAAPPRGGGRTWWAHFEFTLMNIAPTILRKKIEEFREAGATLLNAAA